MGNNRNSSTHASRSKFKKRKPPIKPPTARTVANPTVANLTVANPTVANPTMANPTVANLTVANPTVANPTVANPTVANPVASLNGSRIINLQNLQQHIQTITNHAAFCHSSTDEPSNEQHITVMINEKHRDGLSSLLTSQCSNCREEFPLQTSSRIKGLSGKHCWESNIAAVWGQMSTGGGHSTLVETMAVLGVPTMTKRSFIAAERKIGEWWWTLLKDSMKLAGEEEKAIAINKKKYDQGIPAITVIVDGGWSKRTHKHSYNAKSGVGIIIGKETGKILFMGVRNKYCAVCSNGTDNNPRNHHCFLNWNGSSSAMEADIILEGFRKCYEQHGVRYIEFIGDGDSSVYPTLISSLPWGFAIKKLECANHAVKCYRTALENLVNNNPNYKGKGKLTEAMRKKLTKAARSAIIMRSKESDKQHAVLKLQNDLLNGPLHCFGCHIKCSTDFCKSIQQSKNLHTLSSSQSTPLLQSTSSSSSTPSSQSTSSSQSTVHIMHR